MLEDLRAEVEAVDTVKRRRRPRSVVMPYHSHSFSNDNPLGMGAEAQGISHIQPPRKTFLPQPLSKGARPGIGIQRSSFKQPDVSTVSSVQDTNVEGHETEGIARAPSANQSETGISYQRKAIPITRPVKQEPDHSTFASSPTKVSLFDNMILLPPKPSLGPSGFEEMNKQSERPQSVSSTLSDEQFSDVDASFMMTPRRTGGFTASPQPSQPSSSGNDTPIRTRGFTVSSQSSEPSSIGDETPKRSNRPTHKVEDHEMTPRPLRYSRLPRKDSVSKISSSYDESELVAEKVVLC